MTIWHAMHHLAGLPSRFKTRRKLLKMLDDRTMFCLCTAAFILEDEERHEWLVEHDFWADIFNTRKFWWMRKIKLMS